MGIPVTLIGYFRTIFLCSSSFKHYLHWSLACCFLKCGVHCEFDGPFRIVSNKMPFLVAYSAYHSSVPFFVLVSSFTIGFSSSCLHRCSLIITYRMVSSFVFSLIVLVIICYISITSWL